MGNEQLNGKLILDYMKDKEIKRAAMASRVGVCRSVLDMMVEGYLPRKNRDEILSRLAAELGVSVTALILAVPAGQRTA